MFVSARFDLFLFAANRVAIILGTVSLFVILSLVVIFLLSRWCGDSSSPNTSTNIEQIETKMISKMDKEKKKKKGNSKHGSTSGAASAILSKAKANRIITSMASRQAKARSASKVRTSQVVGMPTVVAAAGGASSFLPKSINSTPDKSLATNREPKMKVKASKPKENTACSLKPKQVSASKAKKPMMRQKESSPKNENKPTGTYKKKAGSRKAVSRTARPVTK